MEEMEKSTFELIIILLGVIIWPLTLGAILFFFRSYFASALNRLGSIQAGATGITMSFQDKISEAQSIISNINPDFIPRSKSLGLNPKRARLNSIKRELDQKIDAEFQAHNMEPGERSISDKSHLLKEKGIIDSDQSKLISVLNEVFTNSNDDITESQILEVEQIVKAFNI